MFLSQSTASNFWVIGVNILYAIKCQSANLISISRGILAILVLLARMGLFGLPSVGHFTFWCTLAGALSDKLDGYLARELGITSRLGEWLDRSIDKLYFATVFLFIWISMVSTILLQPNLAIMVVLMLLVPISIIELFLFSLGIIGSKNNWPIKSAQSGKWKMVFECIAGCWWSLFNDLNPCGFSTSSNYFLWPMILFLAIGNILAAMSLIRYTRLYWPLFQNQYPGK